MLNVRFSSLLKPNFLLKLPAMGHVFDFKDAIAYEQWLKKPENKATFELETQLMQTLLKPMRGESVLDIGCGTGACLQALLDMDLQVTGLDASTYMLDIASRNVDNRADLYQGYAEDLPFDDNSFNYACLFTTLEFVDNPQKALEEACRVAKDRIFIGVLNRYAIKGIQRRVKGMFTATIYNHAQFFSVWELKQRIRQIVGHTPVSWRTVCQLPSQSGKIAASLEQSKIIQRCPFGAFAGMVVSLVPKFRLRPLTMRYHAGN
ncbi:MAG: class I SAM-dependent methyltransferase [Desulfobacterales bacterium]|nr:class I SAM-dependent methyltransferase [Desulfobacterales bacterium]